MASRQSQAQIVFNLNEKRKSYDRMFPGLSFSTSNKPIENKCDSKLTTKAFDDSKSRGMGQIPVNSTGKVNANLELTPKAQKQKPNDVKRWASVVKAQKKLKNQTEVDRNDNHQAESSEVNSEIFDCIFKTFPQSFEAHKSFFVINDKIFHCNICSVNLDSVLNLSNHLKTRKHEDNAIEYFKTKMPGNLHFIMEFVSFFGSNLCCNLCRCEIPMSSRNPHETIVNIMAHNNDNSHVSKRVNQDLRNDTETVLQKLAASSDVIVENLNYVESRMIPEFKCQLCKVKIPFEDDQETLHHKFITHMTCLTHMKNQKAVEVLKLFGEASIAGKDNWVVVNGNIMCTYCNREFETNLQQLVSHVNEVEHATNVLFKLNIPSSFNQSGNNTVQDNLMNEAKSIILNKPKKEEDKNKFLDAVSGGSRLKELLGTMPRDLRDIDYVIENENGSITCLICNRVVPPSTYNLRTHLLGNKHKSNMELKLLVPKEAKDSDKSLTRKQNVSSLEAKNDKPNMCEKTLGTNICSLYGFVSKMQNNLLYCMLCQCSVPIDNFVKEHLGNSDHKRREKEWLKHCPGCSSTSAFSYRVVKSLPASIRIHKCNKMETIPASVLNHLYSLLLDENESIKQNEKVLVKNVDGKHTYCILCKALIPLSLDLDILENNLMSHLREKRHENLYANINGNAHNDSTSPSVARSLFSLADEREKAQTDDKVFNFAEFTKLISKDVDIKDETKTYTLNVSTNSVKEADSGVFVFGGANNDSSEDKNESDGEKLFGKASLPVKNFSRLVKFDRETDEEVLSRRQKQIDYGKNTEGYGRYCSLIPRRKRSIHHPVTPPKHLRCSRRTWDGMIRAWRRQLHAWDPPSTVESDIQPLS